jgi:hypothetical protein
MQHPIIVFALILIAFLVVATDRFTGGVSNIISVSPPLLEPQKYYRENLTLTNQPLLNGKTVAFITYTPPLSGPKIGIPAGTVSKNMVCQSTPIEPLNPIFKQDYSDVAGQYVVWDEEYYSTADKIWKHLPMVLDVGLDHMLGTTDDGTKTKLGEETISDAFFGNTTFPQVNSEGVVAFWRKTNMPNGEELPGGPPEAQLVTCQLQNCSASITEVETIPMDGGTFDGQFFEHDISNGYLAYYFSKASTSTGTLIKYNLRTKQKEIITQYQLPTGLQVDHIIQTTIDNGENVSWLRMRGNFFGLLTYYFYMLPKNETTPILISSLESTDFPAGSSFGNLYSYRTHMDGKNIFAFYPRKNPNQNNWDIVFRTYGHGQFSQEKPLANDAGISEIMPRATFNPKKGKMVVGAVEYENKIIRMVSWNPSTKKFEPFKEIVPPPGLETPLLPSMDGTLVSTSHYDNTGIPQSRIALSEC